MLLEGNCMDSIMNFSGRSKFIDSTGHAGKFVFSPARSYFNSERGPGPMKKAESLRQPGMCEPELKYPQSVHMKIIMYNSFPAGDNEDVLKRVFRTRNIPHGSWTNRLSNGGKYISFTVTLEIATRELLYGLYEDLRKESRVKYVI
jgi:putative lipoic acid-binding regulatory protein